MGSVIFMGIFVVVGLIGLAVAVIAKRNDGRHEVSPKAVGGGVAAVFLVLALVVWLFSSIFSVEARTVGIVTEFGQATGTVNPGFNFLAPWAEVTEFPTSTQNLDLDGKDGDQEGKAVQVKFENGGTGYVNVNVNWKVKGNDEAINLWKEWKEFDKVKDQVVAKRVQTHAAAITGTYEPQEAIKSVNYAKIADAVKRELNSELSGRGVEVTDVNVTGIDVDKDTQARINKTAAAEADVATAEANQKRAKIDNETKRLTQESLTGPALVDQCLKVVNAWDVAKNGPLPAGFNCFGGQSVPLAVGVK